jgi:hypothetical protein
MLVGEVWSCNYGSCTNGVWENVCPYLTHDCKGLSIDEDLNQMREKFHN